MQEHITLEEQQKILRVALGLIREEANWVRGTWKCPVYEKTSSGRMRSKNCAPVQARDGNGNLLYAHCVEGAINQAVYNVLGEERALDLGAAWIDAEEELRFDGDNGEETISYPTAAMQLNEIAYELYAEEMGWKEFQGEEGRYAMTYNDSGGTHKGVIKILKTRLKQVSAAMNPR
jgi:hypothetical protein